MAVPIEWRKSSFSGADSNCVEIGWCKSSFSADDSNCVEIGHTPTEAAIRDSKHPESPYLVFPFATYQVFVSSQQHH
jgi:hypothetical protein